MQVSDIQRQTIPHLHSLDEHVEWLKTTFASASFDELRELYHLDADRYIREYDALHKLLLEGHNEYYARLALSELAAVHQKVDAMKRLNAVLRVEHDTWAALLPAVRLVMTPGTSMYAQMSIARIGARDIKGHVYIKTVESIPVL